LVMAAVAAGQIIGFVLLHWRMSHGQDETLCRSQNSESREN
jgi:hypothetical protein